MKMPEKGETWMSDKIEVKVRSRKSGFVHFLINKRVAVLSEETFLSAYREKPAQLEFKL